FDDAAVLVRLAEVAVDRGANEFPDDQRDEDHGQDLGDAADELLTCLRRSPAEGVETPRGKNAQEGDHIDRRQKNHLQGGQIAVGMLFEAGETLVQLRADGKSTTESLLDDRGDGAGAKEDQRR